jgi:hypothetical protein
MRGRRKARLDSGGMPPGARLSRALLSGHVVRTGAAANDNGPRYRWLLWAAICLALGGLAAAWIY